MNNNEKLKIRNCIRDYENKNGFIKKINDSIIVDISNNTGIDTRTIVEYFKKNYTFK